MDSLAIDNSLKELDDLDAELFGDTLKKFTAKNVPDSDAGSKLKVSQSSSIDDFDDDIDDLLSDDSLPKSKAPKSASGVYARETSSDANNVIRKSALFPGRNHGLSECNSNESSPKHIQVANQNIMSKRASKDNILDSLDASRSFSLENSTKKTTFQSNLSSPTKVIEKNQSDNTLLNKSGFTSELGFKDLGISAASGNIAPKNVKLAEKQKKDDVNFDDSELLDDLGLDDVTPLKLKEKQRSNSVEKSRSFMDDLFGGRKNEASLSSRKQQDFVLDEKYKASDIKKKTEELEFGGYVPSSVVASGPTSRRKSVKFDDDSLESTGIIKKLGNLLKKDNLSDTFLSPKHTTSVHDEASKLAESLVYDNLSHLHEKYETSQAPVGKETKDVGRLDGSRTASNNKFDILSSDAPLASKAKAGNLDWLGVSNEDAKQDQQILRKERSLDFLDDSKVQKREKEVTIKRKDSGADWLGISEPTQKKNIPSDILKSVDKKSNTFIKSHIQDKVLQETVNENMIKSLTSSLSNKPEEGLNVVPTNMILKDSLRENKVSDNVDKLSSQPPQTLLSHAVMVPNNMDSIVLQGTSPQIFSESLNSPTLYAQKLPYNSSSNEFTILQVMVNNLHLERDQLQKKVDSMNLNHTEELETINNSHKNQLKDVEELYQTQKKRVKEEYEAQIHNLKSQVQVITREKQVTEESNHKKIVELEKEYQQEIQRLKDLHSQAVSAMRNDHEEALARLKRLKDQEVEAISSTQVYAKSLQYLTDQLEARTSELADLQMKVDGRQQQAFQERQALLDIKDKELRDLKKRLERQLEESDEERSRLQQLVLRLESRVQLQTKEGEEENWKLQQTKAKLDVQKKIFEEEHTQAFQQIEREKEKLRLSQDSILQEQKTILLQLAQERQQLSSEKMELDLLSKKLKEEEVRLTSARMRDEATTDIQKRSLLKERENLQTERAHFRQEILQLQNDRHEYESKFSELQTETEKLNDSKFTLQRKFREFEERNRKAQQMKEDAKLALTSSSRLQQEHQMEKENFSRQLMIFREKETQLLLEKNALEGEKRFLEKKRNAFLCANCNLSLSYPINALTSDINVTRMPPPLPFASVGVLRGIANSSSTDQNLTWWYVTGQKDKEFLVNEQQFLQSLKESPKKKYKLY